MKLKINDFGYKGLAKSGMLQKNEFTNRSHMELVNGL